jgi:uncharacterized protein YbjT (DUF2867 family)
MAYDLSGPQALTYPEMAEVLSRALGRTISFVSVSDDDYRNGAIAAGVSAEEADALVDLNRYYRSGAASAVTGTLLELTGKAPIPFERFARDYAPALS